MNLPKPFVKKKSQSSLKGSMASINGNLKKSCINMEELMQFEAARQRAVAQMAPNELEKPFAGFVSHRIFVNHIDSFNGSYLVKHLTNITRELEKEGEDGGESYQAHRRKSDDFENGINHDEPSDDEDFRYDEINSNTDLGEGKFSETYEIMGSLEFYNNPKYRRPEGLTELLDKEKKNEFLEKLLTCGFIIYDITSEMYCHPKQIEEAKWVLESIVKRLEAMEKYQPKAFSKYTHCRSFILISTLLTWAKTKPIDPEDPSLPHTERDYRKRRPHPNYKVHCELEKRVIELGKKYPNHLRTIVIGSGVPYGYEEDVLHFFFKMAWKGAPFLPIFKPGTNLIPVIHIDSLASILQNVIEYFPPKFKYIIATDPHSVTLKQLAKLLAVNLGNGKTKMVDKEDAFLYPDIKQRNYDMLSSNLNLTPGYIMDHMVVRWGTELPFTENIARLIAEFKTSRGLLPIKIFVHGPPASGKTFMANRLSIHYDIPHLHEKGVVEETIRTLKDRIEAAKAKIAQAEEKAKQENIEIEGDEGAEEAEESEDEGQEGLEALQQSLREIEENMENNENGRLDEDIVLRSSRVQSLGLLFKEKLSSNDCKNRGYVIDGYPETIEHTKTLYAPVEGEAEQAPTEDEEGTQGGDVSLLCNVGIMPAFVESLDASDEYLINKVIKMPEINMTQFEEHEMCRRLTEFRTLNTEDNTPLIFYDEMEVHPMIYNVENDPDPQMESTFQAIINHVGSPRNYGPEGTLMEEILEAQKNDARIKLEEQQRAQKEEAKKAAEERRQSMEKWMFLKNQELEMEEKALAVMGMPLRHYLMKYIFPCLTRGLVEVARVRPDDPVDFLSEFLFRENPEGKMFQPNYDEREEKLAQAIKEYETMLAAKQRTGSKKSFSSEKSVLSSAVSRVTDYKCSLVSTPRSSIKSTKSRTSKKSIFTSGSTARSSSSSMGVCTCQRGSPSLSTCSSDRTPSTPVSCTCGIPEPCEPCDPCDTPEDEHSDSCGCPCMRD